jgi:hypothetical protein
MGGKAGAGAGPSEEKASHVFLANGHGGDCIATGPGERIVERFTLPEGVYVITVQESGLYTFLSGAEVIRSFARGTEWDKLPPSRTGYDRCNSKYMQFLHEIAKSFDIVKAALFEAELDGDAYNMSKYSALLAHASARRDQSPDKPLCDFYETKIHVHYPGDRVAESTFVPFSYQMYNAVGITTIDGASGLVDRAKLLALDESQRDALGTEYNVGVERPPLSKFYAASVYPTEREVQKFVTTVGAEAEAMDMLSRGSLSIKLSKLVQNLVTQGGVTAQTPIVIYYPVCRFIDADPLTKEAAGRSRAFSLEQSRQPRVTGVFGGKLKKSRKRSRKLIRNSKRH